MSRPICILLATYNGAQFLQMQLDSLARQTHSNWSLLASDDGSTDETLGILSAFSSTFPARIRTQLGPQKGFANNFLSMAANPRKKAPYWAFCDQDDEWYPDKLARSLFWLESVPPDVPALYCSRTELIDGAGKLVGTSPSWRRPPHFCNALIQNIASGNTMVFNEAARQLLEKSASVNVPFHDWWLYMLVSGSGGCVCFDHVPHVRYRQHDTNALGPWGGWQSWRSRAGILGSGQYGDWVSANLIALRVLEDQLTDEAQGTLARFRSARERSGMRRSLSFIRSGVYHQSVFGSIGFLVAAACGKL